MPNVGLFTATDPLPSDAQVSIRYTVEVEGLPVYTELYDVKKLSEEWEEDPERAAALWLRRLRAPVECRTRPAFSSSVTQLLAEGYASAEGNTEITEDDERAISKVT